MPKSVSATRMVAPLYRGWLSTNEGSSRQAANSPSPNPSRLTRLRYTAGMIWSVSTLLRRSGTARPVCVTNGSMVVSPCALEVRRSQVGRRGQPARDRGGGGHGGRHQMGPAALALAALEVTVRRGGAALARGERVGVHAEAHRAARRPPFRARRGEHLVEAFGLGLGAHLHGTRDNQHPDAGRDAVAADHLGGGAQVRDPPVGAG